MVFCFPGDLDIPSEDSLLTAKTKGSVELFKISFAVEFAFMHVASAFICQGFPASRAHKMPFVKFHVWGRGDVRASKSLPTCVT